MHTYANDDGRRRKVIAGLVFGALALAYSVELATKSFGVPWWLDVPASLGCFGLLWWLVDERFWPHLAMTPDLRGSWRAILQSSHGDAEIEGRVEIQQTWTAISIELVTSTSKSKSLTASLTGRGRRPTLTYSYLNEPQVHTDRRMNAHRGTVDLEMDNDDTWSGEYYTGRGRRNIGSITLRRAAHA